MSTDNGPNFPHQEQTTYDRLLDLVSVDSEPFFGDEGNPAEGDESFAVNDHQYEYEGQIIGHRRVLMNNERGRVAVSVYLHEGREDMAQLLAENSSDNEGRTPLGHVEFNVGEDEDRPGLAGMIYVFEDGSNYIRLEITHDSEAVLSTAGKPSYDLAQNMALMGDVWTESAFHYAANDNLRKQVYTAPMSEAQTQQLNQTLAGFQAAEN